MMFGTMMGPQAKHYGVIKPTNTKLESSTN